MVLEIISGKRWTRSIQETNYRDLLTWVIKLFLLHITLETSFRIADMKKIFVKLNTARVLSCSPGLQ
jgi:hypothetical protein